MKKLIAGNWKMNGSLHEAVALIDAVEKGIAAEPGLTETCDFTVCPPFLHLQAVDGGRKVCALGGQDCSERGNGAYTGDISAAMLKDIGAQYVILGHSERRQYHKDSDAVVAAKTRAAHENGLIAIVCVGELEAERERGAQNDVVAAQLAQSLPDCATAENTVIAYEPVWAIGTGKTATPDDIRAMHEFIRQQLGAKIKDAGKMRILYGGSVKPGNAAEIFAVPNVDGALIGGASLKVEDYLGIARAVK